MKVQKIFAYLYNAPQFKANDDSYNYDFGTEYNNPSIKDAIVYSAFVSGFLLLGGFLLGHEDKITKLLGKCKNKLNKVV